MNKQKINRIDNKNENCTYCEVSYWNTEICKVYQAQGFYRVNLFIFQTNCMTFWQNVKQRRQFLGNDATTFETVARRRIVSSRGTTSANLLRRRRLLAQM